jgi:hypothetical protein
MFTLVSSYHTTHLVITHLVLTCAAGSSRSACGIIRCDETDI